MFTGHLSFRNFSIRSKVVAPFSPQQTGPEALAKRGSLRSVCADDNDDVDNDDVDNDDDDNDDNNDNDGVSRKERPHPKFLKPKNKLLSSKTDNDRVAADVAAVVVAVAVAVAAHKLT